MSNEPVAWMYKTTYKNETEIDVISDEFKQSGKGGDCSEYSIPLYTHPVKELTLSNTELAHMWKDAIRKAMVEDGAEHEYLAEAILRKAQEK